MSATSREGAGAFLNGRPIRCAAVDSLGESVVGLSDFSVGRDAPTENPVHLALLSELARRTVRVRVHGSEALDLAWTVASSRGLREPLLELLAAVPGVTAYLGAGAGGAAAWPADP